MSKRTKDGIRLSRRDLFKVGAAAGIAAVTGGGLTAKVAHATGARRRKATKDLLLVNGRIHTMDDRDRVVSSVLIRDGKFDEVGRAERSGGDARVIDLRGATVVPGLIESHTHFVSLANRPGYHVAQWELATNVADVLAILKARRARGDVPPGAFITAMGAGTPNIWFERRQPTLAELDAAVPDRPVFLYFGGGGPARVNTLGKQFFESMTNPTVTVQADGAILGGNPSQANAALYHLRIRQTFEDKKRSALDAMAYTAQVGVTTNLDQTLVAVATGTLQPETLDPQPNHALFNLNHFRMYDAYLALHAEGKAFTRLQMNFLHNQGFIAELGAARQAAARAARAAQEPVPVLRRRHGAHRRDRRMGRAVRRADQPERLRGVARGAAPRRQGALAQREQPGRQPDQPGRIEQVVATYEMMHAEMIAAGFPDGIKSLRWGLQHADHATVEQLDRLKALNCGVSASGFRWTSAPRADGLPVGPMFPRLVASGIPLAPAPGRRAHHGA